MRPARTGSRCSTSPSIPVKGRRSSHERGELRRRLAAAIQTLPERERKIRRVSYEHELTLAEISRVLGVSESRVCQLRSLAVSRLRPLLPQGARGGGMTNRLVTKAEFDAILAPGDSAAVTRYDFRRPDRVSSQQPALRELLHEGFANDAGRRALVRRSLRTTTELEPARSGSDVVRRVRVVAARITAAYALANAIRPKPSDAGAQPGSRVHATADRILGGVGATEAPKRPLTEIEQNVIRTRDKPPLDQLLTAAWRSVGASSTYMRRDTRPPDACRWRGRTKSSSCCRSHCGC